MDYDSIKAYLLSKPEAREDYPFGKDVMVPKIKSKMFATLSRDEDLPAINLKCDPVHAQELRDVFPSVSPGYHMNKKHWNTVILDGSLPEGEIQRMVDHSYSLVVRSLKKAERQALELTYGKEALYKD